jgi:hypothetical protein
MLPAMILAVLMPTPNESLRPPSAASSAFSLARADFISSAARIALSAWFGCSTGAPKSAMMASPMYLSTTPR